jgi:UDPglucose 6-dehydrogenase
MKNIKYIISSVLYGALSFCCEASELKQTQKELNLKVAVIGSGYVGLVSGACFSHLGIEVTCLDVDQKRIQSLNDGLCPIHEKDLPSLLKEGRENKLLTFSCETKKVISQSNVAMICVGTPSLPNGEADLSYVESSAVDIAKGISSYLLVVMKSTVPPGTTDLVKSIILKTRPDLKEKVDFDMADNPEFLREGTAVYDFLNPDRIVIGIESERAKELSSSLYRDVKADIIYTDIKSAELSKYLANAYLATRLSFVNEAALLCEKIGTNFQHVAKVLGTDKRIGSAFLNPGPGYGGSCFPKDTRAIASFSKNKYNTCLSVIESGIESNEHHKIFMAKRISDIMKNLGIEKPKLAILGITFKANTDDTREAASLTIVPELIKKGCNLSVYDPMYTKKDLQNQFKWNVEWFENDTQSILGKDAAVILTDWDEFKNIAYDVFLKPIDHNKVVIIDLRNIFVSVLDKNSLKGISYYPLGSSPRFT